METTQSVERDSLTVPARFANLSALKLSSPAPHVLLITLNRPHALNVFTTEMEEEMRRALEWVDNDDMIW